jgi:hypothetical protein
MSDDKKQGKKPEKKATRAKLEANGDSIELSENAGGIANSALLIGLAGLIAAGVMGGGLTGKQFQHSYLTAYMWALSISVGGIWWVTLQHLFGSRASVVMRRTGEIIATSVWVMAILALPILVPALVMHSDALFPWVDHEYMHSNHALHGKAGYFVGSFVAIRMVVYFAAWIFIANFWLKKSLQQDKTTGDVAFYKRLQANSAPAMIAFALVVTFCAMDFLMSLDPIWFSTIFGVYYFATCVLTFHSVLALTLMWLQKTGHIKKSVTIEHYHDVGKMMFAFTAFWTYICFSQFMLIWYANIPEETHWFLIRMEGTWMDASVLLVAVHFVIPFFGMMSRSMKRHTGRLRFWALYVLVVCWLDMYWLVAPNLHKEGMVFTPSDFAALLGMAGMVVYGIVSSAKKVKLVATGDPRLARALAFENI